MTSPGSYNNIVSRADVAARTPEQTSGAMESRRSAGTRAKVRGDGAVHSADGKHVGRVYRSRNGMAWHATTKGGQHIGLHTSRQEAAGALVRHHEGSC